MTFKSKQFKFRPTNKISITKTRILTDNINFFTCRLLDFVEVLDSGLPTDILSHVMTSLRTGSCPNSMKRHAAIVRHYTFYSSWTT